MVIMEPEEDSLRVSKFFWFLPYAEIKDTVERGRGQRVFSFDQRFVPSDKYSAAKWFYTDEAAGLRAQSDHMVMVSVQNKTFEPTVNMPVKPDDYLDADIFHTGEETEYPGYIIEAFEAELRFSVVHNFSMFSKVHEWHSLDMGFLSPEEVLAMSKVKVTDPEIYNEDAERSPRRNGPEDIRMGTFEKDTACGTCQKTWKNNFLQSCPGHFGHISLEVPIPNWMFIGGDKEPLSASPLLYALNSTCMHCSGLLIAKKENLELLEEKVTAVRESNLLNTAGYDIIRKTVKMLINVEHTARWSEAGLKKKDVPKNITCPHCEQVSPQLTFHLSYSAGQQFVFAPKEGAYDPEKDEMVYYPYKQVHDWLQDISEKDASMLGFSSGSRPADMFFTNLPVIPVVARPPASTPSGGLVPNDLSDLYSNVVKINNRIKRDRAAASQVERLSKKLFQAVSQLLTGQKSSIGSGGMRTALTKAGLAPQNLRGLFDRITGVGRQKNTMRRNHQGKVNEGVAYSVITPDPSLEINEVGVPYPVCLELTIEEEVTESNIEFLRQCVLNGKQTAVRKGQKYKDIDPSRYPGAHYLRPPSSSGYDLGFEDVPERYRASTRRVVSAEVQIGAKVKRNIIAGDIILFTRAPALHRQNMIAFKVVPSKSRSLSFNPSVCIPFNADYDGDAMRMFVPQTKEAIEEARTTMMPSHQMLHTRYGRTFLTFDQDEISGSYLLTFRNIEIVTRPPEPDKKKEPEKWEKWSKWQPGIHPDKRSGWGFDEDGHPILSRNRVLNLLSRAFTRTDDGLDYMTQLPNPISKGPYKGCYRGRDIVSMFIPDGINAEYKAKDRETDVVIEDGIVKKGVLDEKFFGTKSGVLAAAFVYRFGWDEGHRQLERMTNLLSRVVFAAHMEYGFSLGITDISFKGRQAEWIGDPIFGGPVGRFYDGIDEKFEEVNERVSEVERLFRSRRLNEVEGITEADLKTALKDPVLAKEQVIGRITKEYEDYARKSVLNEQPSTNAMNITVNSGGRGNESQLQQMTAVYGQHQLTGEGRPRHGISPNRTFAHFKGGQVIAPADEGDEDAFFDMDGNLVKLVVHPIEPNAKSQGLVSQCYARGLDPAGYWFASTAGRRKLMESSQGGIQKSGYMEHKMKRAMENLMVDEKQRVIDIRSGNIVSFAVGGDGLRPYRARGPDDEKGEGLDFQPLLLDHQCIHDRSLYDHCETCANGPQSRLQFDFLPQNLEKRMLELISGRKVDLKTAASLKKEAKRYYQESIVPTGEMIGSTAAANLGEPATQAGLRAFHGGGKGSVPTVDRLVQYLELKRAEQQQPVTTVYLKDEYNNEENAKRLANFSTGIRLSEIVKSVEYDTENYRITVSFNEQYSELFTIDFDYVYHTLNKQMNKFGREIIEMTAGNDVTIQCHGEYRDLLLAKESLSAIPISGIRDSGLAFAVQNNDNGRWGVELKGPIKGNDEIKIPTFWKDIVGVLGPYCDLSLTEFSDSWMVYNIMGLEASLMHLTQMLSRQMNGAPGVSGIGPLDYRYIRTMTDYMGVFGRPVGLGVAGHMVKYNRSVLAAMGGENPWMSIIPGAAVGNSDKLLGPVEAVSSGKTLNVGQVYREKTQADDV